MKIPKYWAKSIQSVQQPAGRPYQVVIWQWSDVSREEAQQKAEDRVREVAEKIRAGAQLNRYGYGDRPLREEITQGITNDTGNEVAIVTRNLYGALVLNAANAMFIDIDFADKGTSGSTGGGFSWGFGKRAPSQEDQRVERGEVHDREWDDERRGGFPLHEEREARETQTEERVEEAVRDTGDQAVPTLAHERLGDVAR